MTETPNNAPQSNDPNVIVDNQEFGHLFLPRPPKCKSVTLCKTSSRGRHRAGEFFRNFLSKCFIMVWESRDGRVYDRVFCAFLPIAIFLQKCGSFESTLCRAYPFVREGFSSCDPKSEFCGPNGTPQAELGENRKSEEGI